MSHRGCVPYVLALLLTLMPVLTAAQATPGTGAPARMVIAVPVSDLPRPAAEVWLLRYILDPGVSLPEIQQVGPTLVVVEQGEVALTSDGPVTLKNTLGTPPPKAATSPAGSTTLNVGEGALISGGAQLGMQNDSDQQSQLLVLKVFSPDQKKLANIPTGIPTFASFGVTIQPIANGPASFAGGAGVLVIEQDVVGAHRSTVSGTFNGVEVGALEGGEARAVFMSGSNWLWPRILTDYPDCAVGGPVPLHHGAALELTADDGYMSMKGSLTWRSNSDEPLIILRAVVSSIES